MATDYATLKVPDLKKLLLERGLHQSGNKADLIARLQDNDKSMSFFPYLSAISRGLALRPRLAIFARHAFCCIHPS